MIAYEVALKKDRELKDNIDNVREYENGWVFGCHDDENWVGGGGHTSVVILKEDGKAINFAQFVVNGTGEELRSFDL